MNEVLLVIGLCCFLVAAAVAELCYLRKCQEDAQRCNLRYLSKQYGGEWVYDERTGLYLDEENNRAANLGGVR